MEINNKVDHNIVYSNLSHPDLVSENREFRKVVRIDNGFSKLWLRHQFRRNDMKIGDRYVVLVRGRYWYKEGRYTYLLEKVKK